MRYFFNVRNGRYIPDAVGSELTDSAAVREEALAASIEMLKGAAILGFWDGEDWTMHVIDDRGRDVLTLRFSAECQAGHVEDVSNLQPLLS